MMVMLEYGAHKLVAYLGWIGIMLLIGMILRAKIPFLKNWLVPSAIIGGLIGFVLINTGVLGLDVAMFSTIAGQLFTLGFISIGLTEADKEQGKSAGDQAKQMAQGGMGIGLTWCALFVGQLLLGAGFFKLWSMFTETSLTPVHGMMLPRGFAQGPGQAVANGAIYESFGWENAAMVGITFAVFGFIYAYLFGVPLAKYGLKHKLSRYGTGEIPDDVLKGFFSKGVDLPNAGKLTTHSGNIDSFSFHCALVCATYMITYHLTYFVAGFLPETGSKIVIGLLFMWGMFMGYAIRFLLKKLGLMHMVDNNTQKRITGFTTDFMVVAAFMAVSMQVVGELMIPIIILTFLAAVLTFGTCIFFGSRYGSNIDFERTLASYGMATGTAASGIALVRIVDPELKTTASVELGVAQAFMNLTTIMLPVGLGIVTLTMPWNIGFALYFVFMIAMVIVMKVTGVFGKRTYTLKNKCDPPGNCDVD